MKRQVNAKIGSLELRYIQFYVGGVMPIIAAGRSSEAYGIGPHGTKELRPYATRHITGDIHHRFAGPPAIITEDGYIHVPMHRNILRYLPTRVEPENQELFISFPIIEYGSTGEEESWTNFDDFVGTLDSSHLVPGNIMSGVGRYAEFVWNGIGRREFWANDVEVEEEKSAPAPLKSTEALLDLLDDANITNERRTQGNRDLVVCTWEDETWEGERRVYMLYIDLHSGTVRSGFEHGHEANLRTKQFLESANIPHYWDDIFFEFIVAFVDTVPVEQADG